MGPVAEALASIFFTVVSELAFTFYISNYGLSNLVGHYFKIFSFGCVYLAVVKTGIERPYELIFRELDRSNKALNDEIAVRKVAEEHREQLIQDLRKALDEIRTLKGILPICMHCRKVRDDKGYWNQIEKYIMEHSDAELSHGICPECLTKYYSELDLSD